MVVRKRTGILHLTWCETGSCSTVTGVVTRHCSAARPPLNTEDGDAITVSAVQYADGVAFSVLVDVMGPDGARLVVLTEAEAAALADALRAVTGRTRGA